METTCARQSCECAEEIEMPTVPQSRLPGPAPEGFVDSPVAVATLGVQNGASAVQPRSLSRDILTADRRTLSVSALVACFDRYELSMSLRRLTRDGQPVGITSRGVDLLISLVEQAGRVVSHRELLKQAWSGLSVDDCNLRVQICHLRKALEDGSMGRRYIESVPGRGYCFAASVTWRSAIASGAVAAPRPAAASCGRRVGPSPVRRNCSRAGLWDGGRMATVVRVHDGSEPSEKALSPSRAATAPRHEGTRVESCVGQEQGTADRPGEGISAPLTGRRRGNATVLARLYTEAEVLVLDCDMRVVDALLRLAGEWATSTGSAAVFPDRSAAAHRRER